MSTYEYNKQGTLIELLKEKQHQDFLNLEKNFVNISNIHDNLFTIIDYERTL